MNATVDLAIDSATGYHRIEVVTDKGRIPLTSADAAKLVADLSTVLSFTMRPNALTLTTADPDIEVDEDDEEVEGTDAPVGRVDWHRSGKGTSKYTADLGSVGKATLAPSRGGKGWDVKINNRVINKSGPVMLARDAKAMVEDMVRESAVATV